MMGAESKKEKRAAASRVKPRKSPVAIVIPERLMPGSRAMACATPMTTASMKPSVSSGRRATVKRSAATKMIDPMMRNAAMYAGARSPVVGYLRRT